MKNRLKRLQLIMRNTGKKSTIFVSVFALAISGFSVFAPSINTHAADPEVLLEADARIDDPEPGGTPAGMSIGSPDSEKYVVFIDYWYLFEGDNPALSSDSTFEEHKDYALRFSFYANDGYTFSEDTVFTINGQATSKYGDNNQREYIFQDITSTSYTPSGIPTAYTFEKTSSRTELVSWDTDLYDYIENKRIEWSNSEAGQDINGDFREGWEALYVAEDGVFKYPDSAQWVFTGVVTNGNCNPGGVIQVGDPDNIIIGCEQTIQYRIEYEEVTVTKPTYTVKFDDGGIFEDEDKLVDQTVLAGETVDEPWNAEGTRFFDILDYCYESSGYDCYNNYKLEGVYLDPDFNTPFTGDELILEDTVLYINWIDEYEGYERVKEINFSIVPPEPGTEITIEDDDWDTQKPQLEVTLPDGTKYHLYGDEDENYAYWLKGPSAEDYSTPFTGVIEKGGKYYAEVWFKINEGELAIFDQHPTVKVNGEETAFKVTDYSPSAIAILIEIDIPEDEEESATATSPETGATTASGASASLAVSGGTIAIITFAISLFALTRFEKRQ